jgi:hypothetical protein
MILTCQTYKTPGRTPQKSQSAGRPGNGTLLVLRGTEAFGFLRNEESCAVMQKWNSNGGRKWLNHMGSPSRLNDEIDVVDGKDRCH